MKIGENVSVLKIEVDGAANKALYLTLAWDDENLALFDAGYTFHVEHISKAIADMGFDVANLTHIFLTHQDMDHMGGVADLLKVASNAKVLAHKNEAPYIDGRKTPVKLQQSLDRYNEADDEGKAQIDNAVKMVAAHRVKVDCELADGEIVPICGGVKVMHVPGHTPGHAVYVLQQSGVIVLGDSANIEDDGLVDFNHIYIQDLDLSRVSLEKIKTTDWKTAVAYHTGVLQK
ncbi:MAG: MBL fold metallo-hydrolase [Defluviitaleaceae bacterium]|nr:MBL fold metallo-hydrolase [Defluviitaleaceae bacterium]